MVVKYKEKDEDDDENENDSDVDNHVMTCCNSNSWWRYNVGGASRIIARIVLCLKKAPTYVKENDLFEHELPLLFRSRKPLIIHYITKEYSLDGLYNK